MVALTSKEILVELKKLGITAPFELKSYLRKYKGYYTLQYLHIQRQGVVVTREQREYAKVEERAIGDDGLDNKAC